MQTTCALCNERDYIGQGKGGTLDGTKEQEKLRRERGNGKLKRKLYKSKNYKMAEKVIGQRKVIWKIRKKLKTKKEKLERREG
jgi:hypothetical protein